MLNKLLSTAAVLAVTTVAANAEPAVQYDYYGNPIASTQNTAVRPYNSTDGQIQYNDKNISGYQDPYASNSRAYKSNEYGDAALPPKPNVFYSLGTAPIR